MKRNSAEMTKFVIQMAGTCIGVVALYEDTARFCTDYMCQETADFTVTMAREDIDLERKMSAREDQLHGRRTQPHTDEYLETIALQRKITQELLSRDVLLFHGSTIAVDGESFLFTAVSGTGKSTHTQLWREMLGEKVVMVNDDKPFLKITDEDVFACGSPWNGKHKLGNNIHVPLRAICILERGEENEIHEISAKEALPMVFQQTHRPKKVFQYMELIDRLTQKVKFYRMRCTPTPEAAQMAYEAMK